MRNIDDKPRRRMQLDDAEYGGVRSPDRQMQHHAVARILGEIMRIEKLRPLLIREVRPTDGHRDDRIRRNKYGDGHFALPRP